MNWIIAMAHLIFTGIYEVITIIIFISCVGKLRLRRISNLHKVM